MKKEIIINATASELRVAINEDDRLAEIFLDVPDKQRHVGSVFLGRVQRIVQGMNAAFIDIGEEQDAFLHFSDAANALDEYQDAMDDDDDDLIDEEGEDALEAAETANEETSIPKPPSGERPSAPLQTNQSERRGQQPQQRSQQQAPSTPQPSSQTPVGEQRQQPQKQGQPQSVKVGAQQSPKPTQQQQSRQQEVQRESTQQPRQTGAGQSMQQQGRSQQGSQPEPKGGSGTQQRPQGVQQPAQQRAGQQGKSLPQPQQPQQGNQQGRPQERSQQERPQQERPQQQGRPQQGNSQQGNPQQGKPQQGIPQQGRPQQGRPQQGRPQQPPQQSQQSQQPSKPQGTPQAQGGQRPMQQPQKSPTQPQGKREETAGQSSQRPQQQNQQQKPPQRNQDGGQGERRPQPNAQRPHQAKPPQRPPVVPIEAAEPVELEEIVLLNTTQNEEAAVQEVAIQEAGSTDTASEGKKKKRRRGRRGRGRGKGHDGEESTLRTDAELGDDGGIPETKPATEPGIEPEIRVSATTKGRTGRPAKQAVATALPTSEAQSTLLVAPVKTQPEPPAAEAAPAPQKRRATRKAATTKETPPVATEPTVVPLVAVATAPTATQKKAATSRKKSASTTTATEGEPSKALPTGATSEETTASKPKKSSSAKRATAKRATTKRTSTEPPDNNKKKEGGSAVMDAKLPTFQTKRSGEVTIALERGQDILVQVTRESYASKGVRVTTKVTLAGRFLVLLPLEPAVGVSRKIMSVKERRRLRRIARGILPEGHGCIIRTVAQDKDEELIRSDLQKLIETWQTIEQRVKAGQKPGLIYKEQSIAATVMRDLFTPDITRVVIDSKSLHKAIREYVEWAAPSLAEKIELYTGEAPIFEAYGIERELEKMMFDRKVYLPSGGYIILEQTEAMMVIDVNSGRYAGNKEQELNSLKTNIEAAREIARQIRLRDIGGLLVVDFIDLYEEKNRKKVYDELKNHLRRDRAKSVVLPMTQFGLIQMTRQRVRQQVLQTLSEECPTCGGSGMIPSKSTVARKIERWLLCFKETSREFRLTLAAHPSIITYLTEGSVSRLTQFMLKYFVRIKVIPNDSFPVDQFQFFSVRQQIDITEKYMPKEVGGQ